MSKIVKLLFCLSIYSTVAQAQEPKVAEIAYPSEHEKVVSVEQKASPKYSYNDFIVRNVRYPADAMEAGVQGRVYIQFVVEADGSIANAEVIRGKELGYGLPEEALRVVRKMPKWQPAAINGEAVRSNFTVPIVFKLEEDMEEKAPEISSDKNNEVGEVDAKVYTVVDEEAKSGYDWNQYLNNNLLYPKEAVKGRIQGRLMLRFTVTKTGDIENIQILKGATLGGGLPEEGIRVIKAMPKWVPAKVKGVSVDSYRTVPITFKLQ